MSTMSVLSASCFAPAGGMPCRHCTPCTSGGGSGVHGERRNTVIAAARRDFQAEVSLGKTMVCTERAFVATALRDVGHPPLSDEEACEAGIAVEARPGEAPRRTVREPVADRSTLIASARRDFRAEVTRGKVVLCNEAAWVNTALRDAGQGALTDRETTTLAIVAR